jgi:hypothetical protein
MAPVTFAPSQAPVIVDTAAPVTQPPVTLKPMAASDERVGATLALVFGVGVMMISSFKKSKSCNNLLEPFTVTP